jgi:hypothetical protein
MLIKVDQPGINLLKWRTEADVHGTHRRYYCANAPYRAILICDNGLDLHQLIGCVVDCNLGWDEGWREFVREGNARQRHTKITIRRKAQNQDAHARLLSAIVRDAPRDTDPTG